MIALPVTQATAGYLFQRIYSVTVQTGADTLSVWGNQSDTQVPLRVTFEVERKITGGNKSKVTIYNLSEASRNKLKTRIPVQLRAGYLGLVGVIHTGRIKKLTTERNGPDIATTMELIDSEDLVNLNAITKSYGPGTSLITILEDIAATMNVSYFNKTVEVKAGIALGIPNKIFAAGYSAFGSCQYELNQLLHPVGLEWSIQNGELQVIPKTHYNGRTIQVLSSQSGLIGVPAYNGEMTTFSALLNPRIIPGCVVKLQSKNAQVSGVFKVRKIKTTGDTHGNPWNIDCEAVRYDGALVEVDKPAQGFNYIGVNP